jgi:hypothetical protein
MLNEPVYDDLDVAFPKLADLLRADRLRPGEKVELILDLDPPDVVVSPYPSVVQRLSPGTVRELTLTPTVLEYQVYVEFQRRGVPVYLNQYSPTNLTRVELFQVGAPPGPPMLQVPQRCPLYLLPVCVPRRDVVGITLMMRRLDGASAALPFYRRRVDRE